MSEWDARIDEMIRRHLGPVIMEALSDTTVEEIQVNPDMSVHIIGNSPIHLKDALEPFRVESFLHAVATLNHTTINRDSPVLATTLPAGLGKCRLQGYLPPLTEAPSFVLRKPPARVIELSEYVEQGAFSEYGVKTIRNLVAQRANIMVAGPTASGKTTLCNAVLSEIVRQFPDERIIVLEDTRELHLVHENVLRMQTTVEHSMRHLVKYSLRSTPKRIVVGEVRDEAARDLLDAWITGHPGGCGTVHGEDAQRALGRLAALAQEATPGMDQRRMVVQSVQVIIFIKAHGKKRVVETIASVKGLKEDQFILESLPV